MTLPAEVGLWLLAASMFVVARTAARAN